MASPYPDVIDWFTNIDDELRQTNTDLTKIKGDLDQLKQTGVSSSVGTGTGENALLLWPSPPEPPEKISEVNPKELVSTIPQGRTVIDWTNGTVKIPNRPTENLNNKLSGLKSDYVQSIYVNADNHVYWWVPGERTGGYVDQFRGFTVPVVKAKEMWIFAFEPTTITVFAGTQPGSTTHTNSPQRSMERVTSDGTTNGIEITVNNNEWKELNWTNEEDVLRDNPQPQAPLHTMNLSQIGGVFRNTGDNEIHLIAEVKETIYEHYPANNVVGWGQLNGYTKGSPEAIPAANSGSPNAKALSWSDWGHHFLRFKAQTTTSGTTSTIAASFLGKTG